MMNVKCNLGISGEYRAIVRRADGSVKSDTGFQKNLLLDNGIKCLLGVDVVSANGSTSKPYSLMFGLAVGSGNTPPSKEQTSLQSHVAYTTSYLNVESGIDKLTNPSHEGYVKAWRRAKFVFNSIRNQNISELGLVANTNNSNNDYYLVTRALVKDQGGVPITLTVLEGEILEVIYQLNTYIDVRPKKDTFTLTTYGAGERPNTHTGKTQTFDYISYIFKIKPEHLHSRLNFGGVSTKLYTHGVKETDDMLNQDYSIEDIYTPSDDFKTASSSLTLNKEKLDTALYSETFRPITSDKHLDISDVSNSPETGTKVSKFTAGLYSHNHPNGIRGYYLDLGVHTNTGSFLSILILLKDRETGQGIKKTDRQLWEFLMSYTITRWEG